MWRSLPRIMISRTRNVRPVRAPDLVARGSVLGGQSKGLSSGLRPLRSALLLPLSASPLASPCLFYLRPPRFAPRWPPNRPNRSSRGLEMDAPVTARPLHLASICRPQVLQRHPGGDHVSAFRPEILISGAPNF